MKFPRRQFLHLGNLMKRRTPWGLSLLLATFGLATTAEAIVVCFDYALHRAAGHAGIAGCDPSRPPITTYLSVTEMKNRLKVLGYELVSGPDTAAFSRNMFNAPGFAQNYLKQHDVVFLRDNHVGYVGSIDQSTSPSTPLIDHYIQHPDEIRTAISHEVDKLPPAQVANRNGNIVHFGFWKDDPVREFLHNRTHAQGGNVEVWRQVRPADANARQLVCAEPLGTAGLSLKLETAGATCEAKWVVGGPDQQRQTAYCRSPLDGPPAPNTAQVKVGADGSAPPVTIKATWQGFQNLKWKWNVQVNYATFHGRGEQKCKGSDAQCTLTIPARPPRTGPAIGREIITAQIGWDAASGPGNPGVGLPNGLGVNGLGVEQGIDYQR